MSTGSNAEKLLWTLFSDANSRINTLIEECAHLQDTILGLVSDPALIRKIIDFRPAENKVRGFWRAVACRHSAHPQYADVAPRDKAFLSLWNSLGGLIIGLDANQHRHTAAYRGLAEELNRNCVTGERYKTESLYWYISLRGYVLNRIFINYTALLEHAHEKLVQMLENQAGTLPNPILLRRWNSALYGEFLSEYSRHVDWEARRCVQRLLAKNVELPEADEQEERSHAPVHSITHTWTHYPTSLVRSFDVYLKFKTENGQKVEPLRRRFSLIQSAYFYLEQPILFPLLYHECVHINFPSNDDPRIGSHKTFFGARLAAIKSLRLAKFPTTPTATYENFWDHFTEEVWSDAIAIALGGRGYLVSLSLQLLGLSGADDFNHFEIDENVPYPIDTLGSIAHRKYEIPLPSLEMTFLWEARLEVASWILRSLPEPGSAGATNDLETSCAIAELLEGWWQSGVAAYSAQATSTAHAEYWAYRKDLSRWVFETIQSYLRPLLGLLRKWMDLGGLYRIESKATREVISECHRKYLASNGIQAIPLKFEAKYRLEDIALDVRWAIAGEVVASMREKPETVDHWVSRFANWTMGDGNVAFRLALEACRLRISLLDALADKLDGKIGPWDSPHQSEVTKILKGLPNSWLDHDQLGRQRLLRRRAITNSPKLTFRHPRSDEILAAVDQLVDQIMRIPTECTTPEAGTLALGIIRPAELSDSSLVPVASDSENASPYLLGINRVKSYCHNAAKLQENEATGANASSKLTQVFRHVFLPLVGEYQFLTYVSQTTPVERDAHPKSIVPCTLIKPRLVLHVGGRKLADPSLLNDQLWGRVALVRFRYVWQWHDIRARLQQEKAKKADSRCLEDFSLYLSSAWEHVVLITWHKSPADLWRLSEVGLGVGDIAGVDIQSAFYVPNHACQPPKTTGTVDGIPNSDWLDSFKKWAAKCDLVSSIYQRSGRYDYTVVWRLPLAAHEAGGQESDASELRACAQGLSAMPAALWRQVIGMITSFEQLAFSADEAKLFTPDGKPQPQKRPYIALTHFAIRDRRV